MSRSVCSGELQGNTFSGNSSSDPTAYSVDCRNQSQARMGLLPVGFLAFSRVLGPVGSMGSMGSMGSRLSTGRILEEDSEREGGEDRVFSQSGLGTWSRWLVCRTLLLGSYKFIHIQKRTQLYGLRGWVNGSLSEKEINRCAECRCWTYHNHAAGCHLVECIPVHQNHQTALRTGIPGITPGHLWS